MFGVGIVLGEAKPKQSHQNEQLHDYPGRLTLDDLTSASLLAFILIFTLSWTNERLANISRLNSWFFLTPSDFVPKLQSKEDSSDIMVCTKDSVTSYFILSQFKKIWMSDTSVILIIKINTYSFQLLQLNRKMPSFTSVQRSSINTHIKIVFWLFTLPL